MRLVYLHGFASSPKSSKAQFFAAKLREHGVTVSIPQLDEDNFEGLTVTGQLGVIERELNGQPAVLMGSSLGGYLAALYAARHSEIQKLILLAPAFQFPSMWRRRYSEAELEQWRTRGASPVFHYGHNREMQLGYRFMEDSAGYEDLPEFTQPALVFHGVNDDVVPARYSEEFAADHQNVDLRLMQSGHELKDVLDPMWQLTGAFLELD